jgi:hypothetical protein
VFLGALEGSALIRCLSISFPRESRDITVPIGMSKIAAISL